MKTRVSLIAAIAALTATVAFADPVVVQPLALPPQPVRIAPLVLAPEAALATISQIQADHNTVMLSGSTVTVIPPTGTLVTTGSNAGKISINLWVRPTPVTTGTAH